MPELLTAAVKTMLVPTGVVEPVFSVKLVLVASSKVLGRFRSSRTRNVGLNVAFRRWRILRLSKDQNESMQFLPGAKCPPPVSKTRTNGEALPTYLGPIELSAWNSGGCESRSLAERN